MLKRIHTLVRYIKHQILHTRIITLKTDHITLFIMDYYRIDDSYFISLITWLPKVVVFEIVEYTYAKCYDCNTYLLKEFDCDCGIKRCQYHTWLNMNVSTTTCHLCINDTTIKRTDIKFASPDVALKCIVTNCDNRARFGYKEYVYYCKNHYKSKYGIIEYVYCTFNNCYFITPFINSYTKKPICNIHQNYDNVYVYNYVKN